MKHILVSGLINIETTLRVDSFPLRYEPVRFGFLTAVALDALYQSITGV